MVELKTKLILILLLILLSGCTTNRELILNITLKSCYLGCGSYQEVLFDMDSNTTGFYLTYEEYIHLYKMCNYKCEFYNKQIGND